MSEVLTVEPLRAPPDADVVVPGSKSITNRALVCAALVEGRSTLRGALHAEDTEAMRGCLARLGVVFREDGPTLEVTGVGGVLPAGPATLDARLSGTTSRFVLPLLALGEGPYTLDGGAPLRARPMADGIGALRAAGVTVDELGEPGHLPVRVAGPGRRIERVEVPGDVSSQFLSGQLLAAPCLGAQVTFVVPGALVSVPYVEMTVSVMEAFGAQVERDGGEFAVAPTGYRPTSWTIEPDASAASYFFAAAAICGGRVRVEGLGRSSLQGDVRFAGVLEAMGAQVTWEDDALEVVGEGPLHGGTFDLGDISDTAQTLAAVAVFAEGPTEITGVGFIRRKETDRLAAVVTELGRLGITARETPDGLVVEPGEPRAGRVQTYDDHRMAMSFALIGLHTPGIEIADPQCVAKTFPDFFDALDQLR